MKDQRIGGKSINFLSSSVPGLKSYSPKPGSVHWVQTESSGRSSLVLIPINSVCVAVHLHWDPVGTKIIRVDSPRPISTAMVPKAWAELSSQFFFVIFFLASDVGKAVEVCTRVGQLKLQLSGKRTEKGSPREPESTGEIAEGSGKPTHKVIYKNPGLLSQSCTYMILILVSKLSL